MWYAIWSQGERIGATLLGTLVGLSVVSSSKRTPMLDTVRSVVVVPT